MEQVGRIILMLGGVLVVVGLVVWLLGKVGFKGLPGDVVYKSDNLTFYFPIVTCIVVSVILTLLAWLWSWLSR